jgi:hypothetical protein
VWALSSCRCHGAAGGSENGVVRVSLPDGSGGSGGSGQSQLVAVGGAYP